MSLDGQVKPGTTGRSCGVGTEPTFPPHAPLTPAFGSVAVKELEMVEAMIAAKREAEAVKPEPSPSAAEAQSPAGKAAIQNGSRIAFWRGADFIQIANNVLTAQPCNHIAPPVSV